MRLFLEVSKIGYLTWWNFPKKAWLIIIGELAVVTSLSVSLYITYLSNIYFQTYVNSLSPILVPILSVAFGVSSASVATYLYLGMRRIRGPLENEAFSTSVKKKTSVKRAPKRVSQTNHVPPLAGDTVASAPPKPKPGISAQNHAQSQKPQARKGEEIAPGPEPRKPAKSSS